MQQADDRELRLGTMGGGGTITGLLATWEGTNSTIETHPVYLFSELALFTTGTSWRGVYKGNGGLSCSIIASLILTH